MTFSRDGIDSMSMLDLFKMEIESQCVALANDLSALEANPEAVEHLASFQRSLHSLKGAARIVDMQSIVSLIEEIEKSVANVSSETSNLVIILPSLHDLVVFLRQLAKQNNDDLLNWLEQNCNTIKTITKSLSKYYHPPTDGRKLILDRLAKISSDKPLENLTAKQDHPDVPTGFLEDLSLFSIFKEDAENHCAILNDSLLRLEENPKDIRFIEAAMRSTHSIKGAARVIELHKIVELAHAMEDLFVSASTDKQSLLSNHVDLLLQAVDFLKEFVEVDKRYIQKWYFANLSTCDKIIKKLVDCTQGNLQAERKDTLSQKKSTIQIIASDTFPQPDSQKKPLSSDQDSHIKVSSSGLNRLMGLTSEMLAEARWQPALLAKSIQLKKSYENLTQQIEEIRTKFHESHFDFKIELSFQELNKQTKVLNEIFKNYLTEIEDHAISANEISHKLHKEMLNNKMQPFSEGVKGFPRMVRDLSKKLGKNIRFEVIGPETLVDRNILEKIESPLNHLIANAIDHGIEPEAERMALGKTKYATIRLEAKHQAGILKITLIDDGRGLDLDKLRDVIVEKNLVTEKIARDLSEAELTEFIFLPNFSTKTTASHISGRGVGLDVVHSTIKQLRGSISIYSIPGKGAFFEINLPLTLSITRCLTCDINNELYAFPLVTIEYVTKIKQNSLLEVEGRQYIIVNNKRVGIISGQQVLDLKEPATQPDELSVLILQGSSGTFGMVVDDLRGIRELMVHPLTRRLGKLRSVSSASITEDGTPILIMDTQDILQTIDHLISGNRLHRIDPAGNIIQEKKTKKILVVDDSATVREVERKILTKEGYTVTTSVDGLEAWNIVKEEPFDLIITDIDMPHMDGIEFLLQIREDHKLRDLPVIIVSYKDREEDHLKGLNAGADYYLTKGSFQDQTLLDAIYDLIGAPDEY